jgi:hypothetical protein
MRWEYETVLAEARPKRFQCYVEKRSQEVSVLAEARPKRFPGACGGSAQFFWGAAMAGHQEMPAVSEEEWERRLLGGTYGVIGLAGNTPAGDRLLQKLPKNSLARRRCGPVRCTRVCLCRSSQTVTGPSISKSPLRDSIHSRPSEGWRNAGQPSCTSRPVAGTTLSAASMVQVVGDVL